MLSRSPSIQFFVFSLCLSVAYPPDFLAGSFAIYLAMVISVRRPSLRFLCPSRAVLPLSASLFQMRIIFYNNDFSFVLFPRPVKDLNRTRSPPILQNIPLHTHSPNRLLYPTFFSVFRGPPPPSTYGLRGRPIFFAYDAYKEFLPVRVRRSFCVSRERSGPINYSRLVASHLGWIFSDEFALHPSLIFFFHLRHAVPRLQRQALISPAIFSSGKPSPLFFDGPEPRGSSPASHLPARFCRAERSFPGPVIRSLSRKAGLLPWRGNDSIAAANA